MRKLIHLIELVLLAALITTVSHAVTYPFANTCVFKSSVTVVNGGASLTNGKYLYSVIVTSGNSTSAESNSVTFYDSTSTVVTNRAAICSPISLRTAGQYYLNCIVQYGITYVSSGTQASGFTIIYKEK